MLQGSRLSAVRVASSHAACDILGLENFNEDDLYANLDWLDANQAPIENRMFAASARPSGNVFFLYDVTSSYLEGVRNELAAFGYTRRCVTARPSAFIQRHAEIREATRPPSANFPAVLRPSMIICVRRPSPGH